MATRSNNDQGHLYLIGAGNVFDLPVKIGISIDPDDRIATLQTSHWLELKFHFVSDAVTNVEELESWLHWRYADRNIRGEWFMLDLEAYCQIVRMCSNYSNISESKQRRLPRVRSTKEVPHTPSALDQAVSILEHEADVIRWEKQEAELMSLTWEELEKRHIIEQARGWYG